MGMAAASAPGLASLENAAVVAALGMLSEDGVTSNPSFFMSRVTTLKETRMWPWDRTLVTVDKKRTTKRNGDVILDAE